MAWAGVAERHFDYVWANYDQLLRRCMASRSCASGNTENEFLSSLLSGYAQEHRIGGVAYYSGTEYPDAFRRNGRGPVRIVNTRPEIGATIYVNRDQIASVTVPEAFRLLLGELAFHQGWDESLAARVAQKASSLLESLTERILLTRFSLNPIAVSMIAADPHNRQKAAILLSDDSSLYDLSSALLATSPCRDLAGITLRDLAWEPVLPFDSVNGVQPLEFSGEVSMLCGVLMEPGRIHGKLDFRRNETGKRLYYVPGSARFEWP